MLRVRGIFNSESMDMITGLVQWRFLIYEVMVFSSLSRKFERRRSCWTVKS